MGDTKDFLRTIPRTFNPDTYVELSRRNSKDSTSYLLSIVLVSFGLLVLLLIPTLSKAIYEINDQMDNFEQLKISVNVNMTSPIEVPADRPLLILDSNSEDRVLQGNGILVQKKTLTYRMGLFHGSKALDEYFDIQTHKDLYLNVLIFLAFLALPMTLFLIYVLFLLKYVVIIYVLAALGFIYAKITKLKVRFNQVVKMATYASTLPILLEAVGIPFLTSLFFIPQVIHLIYVAIAVILNGQEPGI